MYSNGDLEFIAGFGYTKDEKKLAKEFLVERTDRDKNPGVWDGAPEWADHAAVQWHDNKGHAIWREKSYTRTLPKTKAREIAERKAREWVDVRISGSQNTLEETIEAAILEALGGGK